MISIQRVFNNPISSNCFIIYDRTVGGDCIIVDPGTENNYELCIFLKEQGLIPQFIILTHEHFDHCLGVNELVLEYGIPVICSELCSHRIKYEKKNLSLFYDYRKRFVINCRTISVESINGILPFARGELHFISTPGHTEASISFILGKHLFTGDTLIKGESTVTKLPTGSLLKLKESYCTFKEMQGQGLMVFPGHGEIFELDNYNLERMFGGNSLDKLIL